MNEMHVCLDLLISEQKMGRKMDEDLHPRARSHMQEAIALTRKKMDDAFDSQQRVRAKLKPKIERL